MRLLLVLLLIPGVAAQLDVVVHAPGGAIMPDVDAATFRVEAALDCATYLELNTNVAIMTLTVDQPGLIVTGPRAYPLDRSCLGNPTGHARAVGEFTATAGRDAPALVDVTATADVYVNGTLGPDPRSVSAKNTTIFRVAYVGEVQPLAPTRYLEAAPGTPILFPLDVKNLSNGLTSVTFHVAPVEKGWTVVPPGALILAPWGREGANATAELVVEGRSDGAWTNKEQLIQLSIHVESTTGEPGREVRTLDFMARVRGALVPGFEVVVLAVALIGSAWWRRGRAGPL